MYSFIKLFAQEKATAPLFFAPLVGLGDILPSI